MFWVATIHVSVWYIGGISTPRGCLKFERRHRQWILGSILRFWSLLIASDETTRSGTVPQSLDILISALVAVMPFRCRVLPQFSHLISTAVSPPQAKFTRCSAAPSFSSKLFRNEIKQRISAPDFLCCLPSTCLARPNTSPNPTQLWSLRHLGLQTSSISYGRGRFTTHRFIRGYQRRWLTLAAVLLLPGVYMFSLRSCRCSQCFTNIFQRVSRELPSSDLWNQKLRGGLNGCILRTTGCVLRGGKTLPFSSDLIPCLANFLNRDD